MTRAVTSAKREDCRDLFISEHRMQIIQSLINRRGEINRMSPDVFANFRAQAEMVEVQYGDCDECHVNVL